MGDRWRWILICCALLVLGSRFATAAPSEKALFNSAHRAFDDAFYDKAEKDFGAFVLQFPNSPLVPQAILFQAQSQVLQSNYAGAIALLSSRQSMAGTNADQYVLWLAESYERKGDYRSAADVFARLVKTFPGSAYQLEAVVGEAGARAALGDWSGVITLLQQPAGAFQSAARSNVGSDQVQRGYLLLGEAQMMERDFAAAEATLQPLGKLLLKPELAWRWQYLVCRLRLAEGRDEEALLLTTNLLALATNLPTRDLEAQSTAFRAGVLEGLGRTNDAIAAYTNNLTDGIPPDAQRFALLRMTHLCLLQDRLEDAIQTLQKFLQRYPQAPAADLAWLTLGELQLRQCKLDDPDIAAQPESQPTAQPASAAPPVALKEQKDSPVPVAISTAASVAPVTNCIQLARQSFEALVNLFPQSPLAGLGELNLGWCLWYEGRMKESQKAFEAAVRRLPFSIEKATAFFKLADTQFRQNDFAGALTNYNAVIDQFSTLDAARTNLVERALYQAVRAGLAADDLAAATNALGTILKSYPDGFDTERAVLLAGQEFRRRGNPAEARQIFSDFIKRSPDATLRSEVELAIARTYESEKKWPEAIQQYDHWVATFPKDRALPRAEYYRALANAEADNQTNALIQFTNLVARFPTNEFAAQAQLWVADFYFTTQNFAEAEKNYQLLSHNWPGTRLAYEAKMMAGRSAAAQLSWSDAGNYFTNLTSDPSCPADLKLQARFAYGDALMSMDAADSVKLNENLTEAVRVFDTICQDFPTNQAAALAWGGKARCYANSHQYELALDAYQKVIDAPFASVAARSQALVGMADILEKQAEPKTGEAKTTILELALSHYLDVLYGKILRDGEAADPFWVKEAGLDAFRLAESLQRWESAIKVCERLQDLLPNESESLQKRKVKALENLSHPQK